MPRPARAGLLPRVVEEEPPAERRAGGRPRRRSPTAAATPHGSTSLAQRLIGISFRPEPYRDPVAIDHPTVATGSQENPRSISGPAGDRLPQMGRARSHGANTSIPAPAGPASLRRRGRRLTKQRQLIWDALIAEPDTHLCADDLVERVQARLPRTNTSTVYRTLDLLVEEGLVERRRPRRRPHLLRAGERASPTTTSSASAAARSSTCTTRPSAPCRTPSRPSPATGSASARSRCSASARPASAAAERRGPAQAAVKSGSPRRSTSTSIPSPGPVGV